jgi:hypothetical protein
MLFMQWFQRITLKKLRAIHHHLLMIMRLLGCFGAFCDGVAHTDGIGEPNSAARRSKSTYSMGGYFIWQLDQHYQVDNQPTNQKAIQCITLAM